MCRGGSHGAGHAVDQAAGERAGSGGGGGASDEASESDVYHGFLEWKEDQIPLLTSIPLHFPTRITIQQSQTQS
jgi:hypothetical protein